MSDNQSIIDLNVGPTDAWIAFLTKSIDSVQNCINKLRNSSFLRTAVLLLSISIISVTLHKTLIISKRYVKIRKSLSTESTDMIPRGWMAPAITLCLSDSSPSNQLKDSIREFIDKMSTNESFKMQESMECRILSDQNMSCLLEMAQVNYLSQYCLVLTPVLYGLKPTKSSKLVLLFEPKRDSFPQRTTGQKLGIKMRISSQYSAPKKADDFIEVIDGFHYVFNYCVAKTGFSQSHPENCGPEQLTCEVAICSLESYQNRSPSMNYASNGIKDMHQNYSCHEKCSSNIDPRSEMKFSLSKSFRDNDYKGYHFVVSLTPKPKLQTKYRFEIEISFDKMVSDLTRNEWLWIGFNCFAIYYFYFHIL